VPTPPTGGFSQPIVLTGGYFRRAHSRLYERYRPLPHLLVTLTSNRPFLETVVDHEVHPVRSYLYAGREQVSSSLATHEAGDARNAVGFRGLFLV
jgi:hypothetical protein